MITRWTHHRLHDATGTTTSGMAPIDLWYVAQAAAEETLQGSPLAKAWLTLFRTHLSLRERRLLVWRGDFAESAELRRAYSGLYGRFFARALLSHHLGLTRFVSLERNQTSIRGSITISRNQDGDIPDWIAWNDLESRFSLCEAKGSLTANDFMNAVEPKCVRLGKEQFGRVDVTQAGRIIRPEQWVAATRWATDVRGGMPATLLWDPPIKSTSFSPKEAAKHRKAMTRAWLDSIASGFGWKNAADLVAEERAYISVVVRANPGPIPAQDDWPEGEDSLLTQHDGNEGTHKPTHETSANANGKRIEKPEAHLSTSPIYANRLALLEPSSSEQATHEAAYMVALVNRFGVRPVHTKADLVGVQREQERAKRFEEPTMLIGLPLKLLSKRRSKRAVWVDGAGIAPTDGLAVFDLRRISVEPMESLLRS